MSGKKKLWLFMAIFVVAACTLGYYYRAVHTPEYALEQAVKAVRARDVELLSRYVDVDSVLTYGYDDGSHVLAENIAMLNQRYPADSFFWHDMAFMETYTRERRADSLAFMHGIISRYFAGDIAVRDFERDPTGSFARELDLFQSATSAQVFAVQKTGGKAVVCVRLHGAPTPYGKLIDGMLVDFELERQENDDWKIKCIKNVEALLLPVADASEAYWKLQGWQDKR